jgi:hypothetical protein
LSEDADHDTATDVCDTAPRLRLLGDEGACVSAVGVHALVAAGPVACERSDVLPAASNASSPTVYVVPQVRPE